MEIKVDNLEADLNIFLRDQNPMISEPLGESVVKLQTLLNFENWLEFKHNGGVSGWLHIKCDWVPNTFHQSPPPVMPVV
jgi:hypothetical protein